MTSGPSRWELVAQQADAYETAAAVLLNLLNPEVLRVDGAGGDGGRDALFRSDDGFLSIYEMKSFTGRVDHGRRRKIEKSLARAAGHQPRSWTLVIPIDPSPAELEWFDGLRGRYPFPLSWYGLNWLQARELEQPAFAHYYLHEGASEPRERSCTGSLKASTSVSQMGRRRSHASGIQSRSSMRSSLITATP